MPVITKINTNSIADDAVTGDKFSGSGYLENTANHDLSGTYSDKRLYTSDAYTVTGDVNVTGHLALSSVADSDVVITQDSTERTITGSGTLESGRLMNDIPSLTGMTGELGSAVTGSPAITGFGTVTSGTIGSGVTFPAGHPIAYKIAEVNGDQESTNSTTYVECYSALRITHALSNSSNKLIFTVGATKLFIDSNATGYVNVAKTTDVTTGLSTKNIIHVMGGTTASDKEESSQAGFSVYSPGTTAEFTYTVVFKRATGIFYIANGTSDSSVKFSLMEIVQ